MVKVTDVSETLAAFLLRDHSTVSK